MPKQDTAGAPRAKLVELCGGEVLRLKIPMELPGRPGDPPAFSGSVNSYLIRSAGGRWTIVDPGLYTGTGRAAWRAALASLSIAPGDIDRILITHHHADHAGMAGWFAGRTAAPIHMHPGDIAAFSAEWDDREKSVADTVEQMRAYGMEGREALLAEEQTRARTRFIAPCGSFLPMEDGDSFPVCAGALRVLHVPGHTDGQCALLWPERKLLFAADLLLPVTFSPICLHPFGNQNPAALFLSTLEEFLRRDWSGITVLPGHGWPFGDPAGRAALEAAYYRERAERYWQLCARGLDTAWTAARFLHREEGGGRYLRSAMWEAMAYMEFLSASGRVERRSLPDGFHFSARA